MGIVNGRVFSSQPAYDRPVRAGTRVEVRSRFDAHWARGFEVAEEVEQFGETRYRVRRRSDNSVLPVLFTDDDVREEKRRELWWV
jgi:hypothetical protein